MKIDSKLMTYGDSSPRRFALIIFGVVGAVAGGFWGAFFGISLIMPDMVRYIGAPLSWLLGVAVGGLLGACIGALGACFGCYLMLRSFNKQISDDA
ncbi:MAG: hypothetical protein ACJ74Q_02895 [Pyrinomonadaceae bacterium]